MWHALQLISPPDELYKRWVFAGMQPELEQSVLATGEQVTPLYAYAETVVGMLSANNHLRLYRLSVWITQHPVARQGQRDHTL